METGRIKKIDYERGFGFIEPDDKRDGKDVHFARRAVQRPIRLEDLKSGQRVQFERAVSDRGWTAKIVQLAAATATETQSPQRSTGEFASGYRFFNPYNFV